jgi:prepilin-type processing-associated H-X9-DG protein
LIIIKLGQIRNPGSTQALVFVDQHEKGIDDQVFALNAPSVWLAWGVPPWTWWEFLATCHNNGGTVSFADGHLPDPETDQQRLISLFLQDELDLTAFAELEHLQPWL